MNLLEAHGLLAAIPHDEREALLPGSYTIDFGDGPVDCWPAAAVAAIVEVGWMSNLEASEIPAALQQFQALHDAVGCIDDSEWEHETQHVVYSLLEWGRELELATAYNLN